MINKIEKISLEEYHNKIIRFVGRYGYGMATCPICGKPTFPILRDGEGKFYFITQIENCGDHAYFDLIINPIEADTEGRRLYLFDRLN